MWQIRKRFSIPDGSLCFGNRTILHFLSESLSRKIKRSPPEISGGLCFLSRLYKTCLPKYENPQKDEYNVTNVVYITTYDVIS